MSDMEEKAKKEDNLNLTGIFSISEAFSDPIFQNPYEKINDGSGYTERMINGKKLGFIDGIPLVTEHGEHITLSAGEEFEEPTQNA